MVEKIPVVGIQNSGKTSMIRTFQREFSQLSHLKPTKGIERIHLSFLGNELVIWDYGGQELFREKYLRLGDMHFDELEQLFFIIDLQDQAALGDSIDYFNQIKEFLTEFSPEVTVNFAINKFDPELHNDPEWDKLAQTVGEKFQKLAEPLPSKVFRTSIFNPLSVIHTFSQAMIGKNPIGQNVSEALLDFVAFEHLREQIEMILVLSEDLEEIGGYFSPLAQAIDLKEAAFDIFATFDPKRLKIASAEFSVESKGMEILVHRLELTDDTQKYVVAGYKPDKVEKLNEFKDKVKILRRDIENLFLE